jgi:uncharacterized protein YxeA
MKTRLCSAVSLILIASLFSFTTLAQTNTQRKNPLRNIRAKSEKGPKIKEKIEQLRATHNSVRAALEAFEKKGHKPKIDDAISITGNIDLTREVAFRRANHARQQATITGDGVEVIFITVVDLYNEWQGIAIANFYDANGGLEEQYVADVVITRSEYSPSEWTARFELKFESDGVGYLNHRPGMFTNFSLGTPVQQQTAPLSLNASQFASTEQADAYYNLYPLQVLYDIVQPGGSDGGGDILPIQPARFSKPQWYGPPRVSPWAFYTVTGWGATARSVGIGCSIAAGACSVGVVLGGISAVGCLGTGCTGAVLWAAGNNLRVVRR